MHHLPSGIHLTCRFGFVSPTSEVVALAAFALALSATRYLKKHGDFRKHSHVELLF
jgi:hypothetical protein